MNFRSSIAPKIKFTAFNRMVFDNGVQKTEQDVILDTIEKAYNKSSIARKMIDDWVITKKKTIQINYQLDKFAADKTNKGTLWLDLDYIKDWSYITTTGKPVAVSLMGALMHEFGHAFKNFTDPQQTR